MTTEKIISIPQNITSQISLLSRSMILMLVFFGNIYVQAKEPQRPNILFIIADDASMKSLGAYGSSFVNTPAVDKLAKEGAIFTNAFNNNPKCAPARACIVTGKYSWQLKEATNHYPHFPSEFKFYPHLLMEAGYHVGYTGKGWGPGSFDGPHNPAGPAYNEFKLDPPYKGISNIDYATNFEAFLDKKGKKESFCFWLGTKEPHRFYELDSWKKEGRKLEDAEVPPFYPDNDIIRGDLLDYALEVEWFDKHIGRAVAILKDKDLLENTLIVVTSDHGMPFPRVKGQLYEEGFHVPFIVYWKGKVQAGRVIEDFISFPDVAPTFMQVAGLPIHEQMTGKSFLDLLMSPKSGQIDPSRDHVLLGKERHDVGRANEDGTDLSYPVRAIRNEKYLYVHNIQPERWPVGNPEYGYRNCDGSPTKSYLTGLTEQDRDYPYFEMSFGMRPEEELYDLQKDPHCIHNLAVEPQYAATMKELRDQMEKELTAQGDPRTLGNGKVFDQYPYMGRRLDYKTGERAGSAEK
ncbi:MAG: sulfatase [Cyclobacteriaceae bacterium]